MIEILKVADDDSQANIQKFLKERLLNLSMCKWVNIKWVKSFQKTSFSMLSNQQFDTIYLADKSFLSDISNYILVKDDIFVTSGRVQFLLALNKNWNESNIEVI